MRYLALLVVCLRVTFVLAQSCTIPTPPSNAIVFNQIQQRSGVPNTMGNIPGWRSTQLGAGGPAGSYGPYWMVQFQKSPSLTGGSAEIFAANATSKTNANALFYKKVGYNDSVTNFLSDFYVLFDSGVQSSAYNLEFDMFQFFLDSDDNRVYELMMGTQCDLYNNTNGHDYWDVWNSVGGPSGTGSWVNTNISCRGLLSLPPTWHHIQMYGTTTQSAYPPEYAFQCLALDGVTSSLSSYTYDGLKEPTSYTHNLGVQWQLDVQTSSGLHEWIDNATFSVWAPSQ